MTDQERELVVAVKGRYWPTDIEFKLAVALETRLDAEAQDLGGMADTEQELVVEADKYLEYDVLAPAVYKAVIKKLRDALEDQLNKEVGDGKIAVIIERLELGARESTDAFSRVIERQSAEAIRQLLREQDGLRQENTELQKRVKELEYVGRKVVDAINRCQFYGDSDRLREWANKLEQLMSEVAKP